MSDDPINVLFATCRMRASSDAAWGADFTDTVAAFPGTPDGLSCGVATLSGIRIDSADAGTIDKIGPISPRGFSEAQLAELLAPANSKDILVFVHGTDNSFRDALARTAYNWKWLKDGGIAGSDKPDPSNFDMIAFTWPARGYSDTNFLGYANLSGDYQDYRHDQDQATKSAYYFGYFLQLIAALRQRTGRRRVNLLCHSMGHYMLGAAVEMMFAQGQAPSAPLFDEIVLAAGDELATTFAIPNGGRLSNLWRLGNEITVYSNKNDALMKLSRIVNAADGNRLGYEGPPNAADTRFFSSNVYEFIDCTGIDDSLGKGLMDTHQYYRESRKVRADIVSVLLGSQRDLNHYDYADNMYRLF